MGILENLDSFVIPVDLLMHCPELESQLEESTDMRDIGLGVQFFSSEYLRYFFGIVPPKKKAWQNV
jgi:hypothetical protein